jgi:RNA polymerase sigma-B factor
MVSDLRARDRSDLMVLVSEVVAAVATDSDVPVSLDVMRNGTGIRVEASCEGIAKSIDPLAENLLETLASSWFVSPGTAVFTLDHPYTFTEGDDEQDLFTRSASGDSAAKAELVGRYETFARSLARRFAGPSPKREELEQVATVALVGAVNRFDLERGFKFTTFAARSINGELKRYLRDSGWSLRVPRSLQELGLEARLAAEQLVQSEGREPTLDELAERIDADPGEVGHALLARKSFSAASLDAPPDDEDVPALRDVLPSHDARLDMAPELSDLSLVMGQLPEREQRILYLRFYEDLSQSEIAERVGISQMHVSRLLARSVESLREWLQVSERDGVE